MQIVHAILCLVVFHLPMVYVTHIPQGYVTGTGENARFYAKYSIPIRKKLLFSKNNDI